MSMDIAKEIGNKEGVLAVVCGNLGTYFHSLGQYDKAIKYQEMKLNIAKEIGHKEGEAAACASLGICFDSLGQYNKVIKYQEMSVDIAKEIGHNEGVAAAYGNLGTCFHSLSQYDKAIKYQEMNLNIAKEIGHKKAEAVAYGKLGDCFHSLGQYEKAIEYLEMNLNIAKEIGHKKSEAVAYGKIGDCFHPLGQYKKAIKYQEMNLNIAKETGHKTGEAVAYGKLGNCLHSLGQYEKAIEYLEMNLNIAKETGHKKVEAVAYGKLGNCLHSLGQYDKDIEYQEMNLKIAKEIGHKEGEATAYGNLGTCVHSLGQNDKAIKYLEMNLKIAKEIGHKKAEALAYGKLGNCLYSLGQYDKAIRYHEMRLNIAEEIGDKQGEAAGCWNLGTCFHSLGQDDKAIKNLETSLNILKRIGHKEGEAVVCGIYGKLYNVLGQYRKAESFLRKGVSCFEDLFENVPMRDEVKVSFIDLFIDTYEDLVHNLLVQDKRGEALVIAEKGRAIALTDLMFTANLAGHASVTTSNNSELHKIRKLVETLDSTVLFFTLLHTQICTWIIQRNGDVMFRTCDIKVKQFGKQHGKEDSSKDLQFLVNKTLELMTSCGKVRCEDRSLSFLYPKASKPTNKKHKSAPARFIIPVDWTLPQAAVCTPRVPHTAAMQEQEIVRTTSSESQDKREDHDQPDELTLKCLLKQLYQILLYPVRQYITGSQAIIVPDGPLALVPFAALVDENGQYLVKSLRVRLIPSLKTAEVIRGYPEQPAGLSTALVIGDPEVGSIKKDGKLVPVPSLPSSRKEVEMVGNLLKVEPLVGERATKDRFLQSVESANMIHIAAHGDAERGEILLAPSTPGTNGNDPEDIMLKISDLEGKRIKAKLVVLSSCYSGRGKVCGEGVVGIARAFLGAGARAVLVTLWAVHDKATLGFMCYFYGSLSCGKSVNEALNEAMNGLRRHHKNFRHPRYWAPFVLLGENVTPLGRS